MRRWNRDRGERPVIWRMREMADSEVKDTGFLFLTPRDNLLLLLPSLDTTLRTYQGN